MTCPWDVLDWFFAGLIFMAGFVVYPIVRQGPQGSRGEDA